jgi:hypothetical protein
MHKLLVSIYLFFQWVRENSQHKGRPSLSAPPTPPDIRVTYPAIRLVKTDTNEYLVCLALGNATLPAFQQLLRNTSKNTLFDSHNHLPKPFGWAPFSPSSG